MSAAAYPQIQVGSYFDLDSRPIEGPIYLPEYNPENELKILHHSIDFEQGHYYNHKGEKRVGKIKFKSKKFWFEDKITFAGKKLKPEDASSLVIGVDSFFVVKNFTVERQTSSSLRQNPEFVQFVTHFGDLFFAKHYLFTNQGIVETYMVKRKGQSHWESFPKKKKAFKKIALKYFNTLPGHIIQRIDKVVLDQSKVMTLIKMAEYQYKYENNEKIFFDKNWHEINKPDEALYYAKVDSIQKYKWTLTYFQNDKKLCTAEYISFYPNKKSGDFTSYNEEGKPMKTTSYRNDKPKKTIAYFKNGQVHYVYNYELINAGQGFQTTMVYTKVNDLEGKNLLDEKGNGKEVYFDPISERTITSVFKANRIVASYRTDEQSIKIYQPVNPELNFKLDKLQGNITAHLQYEKFDQAVKDNAQGLIMIYFSIDPKGHVSEYKILNKLHPQLDKLVKGFLSAKFVNKATGSHRFKPYKVEKEKVNYEVVVPVRFQINRFYRAPSGYYFHDHFWMHNSNMFPPLNVTVPSFPR